MKIKSLGLKVSIIVTLVIATIVIIITYVVSTQSTAMMMGLSEREAVVANSSLVKEVQRLEGEALARARIIAYSFNIIEAMQDNDDVALKSALQYYSEGMDVITLTDSNGNVLMRVHSDMVGDNVMSQKALSTAINTLTSTSLIESGSATGMATRGAAPIFDFDGELIGAVVCGHNLSNPEYVDYIKELLGAEITIFEGDMRLSSTIIDDAGNRVIGTQLTNQAVIDAVLINRQDFSLQITLFGHEYFANYSPIISDGEAIGMLFAGVPIEATLADQRNMMNTVILLSIVCGVAGVILVFVFNIFSVSRPLKKIGVFAEKIKTGDLGLSKVSESTIAVRSSDEVGMMARTLEAAYSELKGYIGEIKEKMTNLADGDLTKETDFNFQGDFVLIKDAINEITRNLNQTLAEINTTSAQVSIGAKQVADGAQSLAQGSTEQAASVQQLSSSIAEIAESTKANAATADRTSKLSANIKESAERGSRQMDEMISAVKDINDASTSISKIIKTIDDIAFQTNILALNAAVEAARAGQHGKGFAVVAEEVRNLASKSAEAAKDTDDMIQDSMKKAEFGSKIAGETAESLSEIVSGINESNQLVIEIAESSEQQSMGISQINTGIDQVAQVVQQNSATAQQSAAASEQMSGPSTALQQLISQFKLKDNGKSFNLPPSAAPRYEPSPAPQSFDAGDGGSFGKY
ncbi:MAG: methyl-accepting chemotaxis protein [Oscillospiraceae bacterium]|jgi:methyl-accepting chemotaxis protein|nr:methyl-accepting chemotaxis protein [Oscillospiraceae bacterium]